MGLYDYEDFLRGKGFLNIIIRTTSICDKFISVRKLLTHYQVCQTQIKTEVCHLQWPMLPVRKGLKKPVVMVPRERSLRMMMTLRKWAG